MSKGGGEILLRLPAACTVPNHSRARDELYVWLNSPFTYIAADGKQAEIYGPAYISLPSNTPLALKCHNEPCVLYVPYGRPFDASACDAE
jgi:hypothetical protein